MQKIFWIRQRKNRRKWGWRRRNGFFQRYDKKSAHLLQCIRMQLQGGAGISSRIPGSVWCAINTFKMAVREEILLVNCGDELVWGKQSENRVIAAFMFSIFKENHFVLVFVSIHSRLWLGQIWITFKLRLWRYSSLFCWVQRWSYIFFNQYLMPHHAVQ